VLSIRLTTTSIVTIVSIKVQEHDDSAIIINSWT